MNSKPPHSPTERLGREIVHENPYLRVLKDHVRFHSGREATHWKIDYTRHGVGVVPVLPDGRVMLGLHYRYCAEAWGWEIAAGGMHEDETREETARRELEEETGHTSGRIEFLTTYHPAPGLGNETFHLFAAHGCQKSDAPRDHEEIYEVRAFTWDETQRLMEEGKLFDGFTVTGLALAKARGMFSG